jgi:hypothetical protein
MAVALYVGGHGTQIAGEKFDLGGHRCFSAVHRPPPHTNIANLRYLLDSGAFSDAPEARLTPDRALDRQLQWEAKAADLWGVPVASEAIVSYDLLIDEVWTGGVRHKRRWSVEDAEAAVRETVDAAAYLASRRRELQPRRLVLSCQGVDASQYVECTVAVLSHAEPDDWIGLGGWCIVGRFTTWLPEFRRTMARVVPLVAAHGITRVHLFGVLYEPAVAALLWLADQYGIEVSTDSTAPVLAATRGNPKKAGMRASGWRQNVAWWQHRMSTMRQSRWYGPVETARQLELFATVAPDPS